MTSILATKLYIPPLRKNVVSRPRLIERLNEQRTHRISVAITTLVSLRRKILRMTLPAPSVGPLCRTSPSILL